VTDSSRRYYILMKKSSEPLIDERASTRPLHRSETHFPVDRFNPEFHPNKRAAEATHPGFRRFLGDGSRAP
jgi:hypothetical protein